MPYIPATIIVKFKSDVSREEIQGFLKEEGLEGLPVSDFINRWAIDVVPGKEEHYIDLFKKHVLTDSVCANPIKGFKPVKREKNEQASHPDSERLKDETREGSRAGKSREHGVSVSKNKDRKTKGMAGGTGKKI